MQNQNHKYLPYIIHLSFRSTISTWVQIIPQKKGRATLRKEIDAPKITYFLFSVAPLPESNNCTIRFSLVSPPICYTPSFCRSAACSSCEKFTCSRSARSFNHFGIVNVFFTAFSKCVFAYSATSTVTILTKASS